MSRRRLRYVTAGYRLLPLDRRGLDWLRQCVSGGGGLGECVARRLGRVGSGVVLAYAPAEAGQDRLYEFDYDIFYRTFPEEWPPTAYAEDLVPGELPDEFLERTLCEQLASDPGSMLIRAEFAFQDSASILACGADGALVCGGQPYGYVVSNGRGLRARVARLIGSGPDMFARLMVGQRPRRLRAGKPHQPVELTEEDCERLGATVKLVAVPAYDFDSYLIWTSDGRAPLGSTRPGQP